ncbi:tRNA 2-thiouridine(34) synthase MnmA [Tengunoibacter tsumagoiensis]|uniref:tRNA-specific 2-thiouridylase MnmA n=1 Tax=Tengunoibacter tsumagoiensis TaxID=2014871 RepID=A0A401ZXV4_9CHLR|nr:tRNA 2-thiouridine(34) synthase MnmA [Tengunoibacter tsumagoiensis]GCE11663.1 tRNA-specific 2-thiouridylase MnmA [Tengunoibacter tsumagoiensis]
MARIVVAMSGGVDSSVAAALLKEQGHEVIGIMLRLWSEPGVIEYGDVERVVQNKCCSLEAVDDARRVARMLDIPFYLVNVEQEFKDKIVDTFYEDYVAGRTPNPCLNCNRQIRFTTLLNRALALDADYLATGHYVQVDDHPVKSGKRRLRRGVDPDKDQSYVLHVLNQHQLAHACFPLGGFTKPQVRAMAAERGMTVAQKAESQEICFVAQNDYRGFIDRYAESRREEQEERELVAVGATRSSSSLITIPRPGPIYNQEGKTLGRHRGLAYYTIGQRKGLGITSSEPLHVLKIDATNNALVVGPATALDQQEFVVGKMHYLSGETPAEPFDAQVRVRYKAPEQPARVTPLEGGRAHVTLLHPQRAITPGQAAVFYGGEDGDEVLCGGIIE